MVISTSNLVAVISMGVSSWSDKPEVEQAQQHSIELGSIWCHSFKFGANHVIIMEDVD